MYQLGKRLALIRTAGDLGKELQRISHLVKVFALFAIVFVASFTVAQLLELAFGNRAGS